MTGAYKTRRCKKFVKSELDGTARDPDDYIANLELLRRNLIKLGFIIDDVEMMTHILSNITEYYKNTAENLEYKLDDEVYPLTIEMIRDRLSEKLNIMNVRYNKKI